MTWYRCTARRPCEQNQLPDRKLRGIINPMPSPSPLRPPALPLSTPKACLGHKPQTPCSSLSSPRLLQKRGPLPSLSGSPCPYWTGTVAPRTPQGLRFSSCISESGRGGGSGVTWSKALCHKQGNREGRDLFWSQSKAAGLANKLRLQPRALPAAPATSWAVTDSQDKDRTGGDLRLAGRGYHGLPHSRAMTAAPKHQAGPGKRGLQLPGGSRAHSSLQG